MNRSVPLLLVGALGCAAGGLGVVVPIATLGTATAAGHSTFCGDIAFSDSTVYDTTQVTERPILYKAEPLHYPAKARPLAVRKVECCLRSRSMRMDVPIFHPSRR